MDNLVHAYLRGPICKTAPLYQYDYGQVLKIHGIELPSAYEVHFSNTPNGNSTTAIGNADGVVIPDAYLRSGAPVYAWLYLHTGESDGETVYHILIPVMGRAAITNQQPTPVQQDTITQTIAALNAAVDEAEEAASHYPVIVDGTWRVWDAATGEYVDTQVEAQGPTGADGYSPSVSVSNIVGGHKVTITDKTGTHIFTVMDGSNGTNGTNGVSPTIAITDITGGHRVSITDVQGTNIFDVLDGASGQNGTNGTNGTDGADGTTFTPSVASNGDISWTNDGGKTNPQTVNIKGPAGQGVASGGTQGQMLVKKSGTDYDTEWANQPSVPVQDVQVNGTSILSNGVANVPIAGTNKLGTVLTQTGYGITVSGAGRITINSATSQLIKAGEDLYKPVTPVGQHESTFYGLAKAAGDSTQSASSNAVGMYTNEAKIAIQKMLGLYKAPFRIIKEITITEETPYLYINTDSNGDDFSLEYIVIEFSQVTATNNGSLGISVNSGYSEAPEFGPFYTLDTGCRTTAQNLAARLWIDGGHFFGEGSASSMDQYYSAKYMQLNKNAWGIIECGPIYEIYMKSLNSYKFTSGTIKIWGR